MDTTVKIADSVVFRRFQELTIYFFAAAFVGHYLEFTWILLRYHITSISYVIQALTLVPLPLAEPYGFGVVAAVLCIAPVVKRYRLNPALVFILSAFVMTAIEYICATILALIFGRNTFWDYTGLPFNLQGYICLESSLWFGLLGTLFIYFVYPWAESRLKRIRPSRMHALFTTLVVLYVLHFVRLALLMR